MGLTERTLVDELIMLDRKTLADRLSDLNGWGLFSLSRHQLETGLRFRQLAVVEEVLNSLSNVRSSWGCVGCQLFTLDCSVSFLGRLSLSLSLSLLCGVSVVYTALLCIFLGPCLSFAVSVAVSFSFACLCRSILRTLGIFWSFLVFLSFSVSFLSLCSFSLLLLDASSTVFSDPATSVVSPLSMTLTPQLRTMPCRISSCMRVAAWASAYVAYGTLTTCQGHFPWSCASSA